MSSLLGIQRRLLGLLASVASCVVLPVSGATFRNGDPVDVDLAAGFVASTVTVLAYAESSQPVRDEQELLSAYAAMLHVLDPSLSESQVKTIMQKNVDQKGWTKGFVVPALNLLDAGFAAGVPEIGDALNPLIARAHPPMGRLLHDSLGYRLDHAPTSGPRPINLVAASRGSAQLLVDQSRSSSVGGESRLGRPDGLRSVQQDGGERVGGMAKIYKAVEKVLVSPTGQEAVKQVGEYVRREPVPSPSPSPSPSPTPSSTQEPTSKRDSTPAQSGRDSPSTLKINVPAGSTNIIVIDNGGKTSRIEINVKETRTSSDRSTAPIPKKDKEGDAKQEPASSEGPADSGSSRPADPDAAPNMGTLPRGGTEPRPDPKALDMVEADAPTLVALPAALEVASQLINQTSGFSVGGTFKAELSESLQRALNRDIGRLLARQDTIPRSALIGGRMRPESRVLAPRLDGALIRKPSPKIEGANGRP